MVYRTHAWFDSWGVDMNKNKEVAELAVNAMLWFCVVILFISNMWFGLPFEVTVVSMLIAISNQVLIQS